MTNYSTECYHQTCFGERRETIHPITYKQLDKSYLQQQGNNHNCITAYTKERNTRHIKEIEELANKRKKVKHRKEYGQRQVTTHPHKQRIPNTQTKQEEIEEIQQNKKRLTTQKIKNTHQSTDKETTKHQYTSQYTTRRHNTKPYQH